MDLPKGYKSENKGLSIKVKLTETDTFRGFFKEYNSILEDERIDKNIREEYSTRFEKMYDETFNK